MRIRDILEKQNGIERFEAANIVAYALSMRKEEVFTNFESEVDECARQRINDLLEDRKRGKPFAYITGHREFFSEKLYVDERVLIPRPETEILVEEALRILSKEPGINSILDVGTGSGAIGLVLAKNTQKHIVCTDISLSALRVAQRNRESLGLSERVCLVCSDLFCAVGNVQFDMILANLPYVASEEWDNLMADVRDYEPRAALDGGSGGIDIYKRFIDGLPQHLKKGGHVLCEVGGTKQTNTMSEMLQKIGLSVVVKNDLSGNTRVLIGSWTSLS